MDELELLKKDWNKSDNQYKSFSDSDIYKMSHKKSSSIVKTLFYISVAELAFWILISFLPYVLSDQMKSQLEEMSHSWIYIGLNILSYVVIVLFVYLLWRAHKAISVTDNAKKLMESILKTRKIIKYYVLYNLFIAFISIPVSLYFSINEHPEISEQISTANFTQLLIMALITLGITAAFLVVIWLFYKLIYGILIKRLNRNYKELKKLEI
ncbi:hypothetical protein [Winogradskyella sediminis]|uniref:Uncharacterized protein n=1 Tax=Winogradskyella sediminis TaxID=1382466 RepID=A0A1H1MIZ1_9FLAO|nr:hypothetical protein [Winogradskyella sediminis]REG84635.1 hypothetical protein C8N41_10568 [Winogradskyella sediminis]SDR86706.1 hypothetical protein SAMN04489797_0333 [Winogradskyella sediminis]